MDCLTWLRKMCGKFKNKLYDSDLGSNQQLDSQSSPEKRNGKFGQNGKIYIGHTVSGYQRASLKTPG